MKKVLSLVLCLVLMMSLGLNSYAESDNGETIAKKSDVKSTNPLDYPRDTEERYIASIAQQKGVTFEEAKKINDAEVSELLEEIGPMAEDETIKYKTVDKKAGVVNTNKKDFNVNIATEVRYLWSNVYSKPLRIENVGNPIMYIPGFSVSEIVGGGFNIEKTSTTARISQTAALKYSVSVSLGISVGEDIVNVSGSVGGMVYLTTKAKTFVINIGLSDLY